MSDDEVTVTRFSADKVTDRDDEGVDNCFSTDDFPDNVSSDDVNVETCFSVDDFPDKASSNDVHVDARLADGNLCDGDVDTWLACEILAADVSSAEFLLEDKVQAKHLSDDKVAECEELRVFEVADMFRASPTDLTKVVQEPNADTDVMGA